MINFVSSAKVFVAATVVLLAGACPGSEVGIPAGAVEVDTDLYMVPVGEVEGPCRMWRMYSPTLMTTQVTRWHHRSVGFDRDFNPLSMHGVDEFVVQMKERILTGA